MFHRALAVVFILLQITLIQAQDRSISGKVTDTQGQPLPGANILVTGPEKNNVGVVTDFNGEFTIEVPAGYNTLEASYLGFISQSMPLEDQTFFEILLQEDATSLDEIVVTALGISREKKALGYAVQDVEGKDLQSFSRLSPIEGLSGKISGLNVSNSGNGPGSTTKVLIRGVNSLTGTNEPLYVVDGVPMDNSGGAAGGEFGGFDYGNAANNINPDDIETVTVLKGGAASALYGSRGQNGVIMITTKKGSKSQGVGISYATSFESFQPLITPDFQNEYSQGSNGQFESINFRSWGAKMTGQTVTNFLNESQVLTPNNEDPYRFLRTGTTYNNTITISKRGDRNGIYFSASNSNNNNMLPNSTYEKSSFALRFDSQLADYLKLDAKANYIVQDANNRPNLAASPDNVIYLLNVMPRSVFLNQLNPFQTVDGLPVVWNSTYQRNQDGTVSWRNNPPIFASSPLLQNPYWATELNNNYDNINRIIGFGELTLDFQKLLDLGFRMELKGRAGIDYYTNTKKRFTANNTYYKADGLATIFDQRQEIQEVNYDFLLTLGDSWGDFNAQASLGGNLMHREIRSLTATSESGLINEVGPYVIQNFLNPITNEGISDLEIQSLYALFSFDYKRQIYLDVTFRNDWTSVLAPENWSYLYPSVSFSWLMNETLSMPDWVNLLKLRGSYAGVGNGGNFASYRYTQFGTNPNQFNGLPYGFIPSTRPEPNLKSEYTESIEGGINAVLFDNRFSLDVAYYETGTKDQIFNAPLPPSSGFNSGIINAGYIKNSGVEISLTGNVIRNKNWNLNLGLNATRAWSEVEELNEEVDVLTLGGAGGVIVAAKPGEPVGILMGSAYDRDEQGNLILDEENLPRIKTTEDGAIDFEQIIGQAYPKWLLGLNGSLSWKNLGFSFLIDSKLGHDLYSLTNQRGAQYGTLEFTTEGRDAWEEAKAIAEVTQTPPADGYLVEGVKDGVVGSYPVDPQRYWDRASRVAEEFIYDASYVRLRQIGLSYRIPSDILDRTPFRAITLGAMVNNALYLYNKVDNVSPESSFGTGNAVGYEMFSFPEARTFMVNLTVDF